MCKVPVADLDVADTVCKDHATVTATHPNTTRNDSWEDLVDKEAKQNTEDQIEQTDNKNRKGILQKISQIEVQIC